MSITSRPPIELPPGAHQLGPRAVAKRLGVTVDTAERMLSEGRLVAYRVSGSPQIHLEPAERYEVNPG